MLYIKETLTFKNSPMDSFVVYDGTERVQTDYKALDRAMRKEAFKYIGRVAYTRFVRRMKDINDVLDSIRV